MEKEPVAKATTAEREAAIMAKYREGEPTEQEDALIKATVFTGDPEAVRAAIGAGASPLIEYRGRPLAFWARLHGQDLVLPELARACCRLGVEDILDSGGLSLMDHATTAPSPRTMALLFAFGVDVDAKCVAGDRTALIDACIGGWAECVEVALAHGASVDAVDRDGKTALFHAAIRGYCQCARMLLEAGADPKIKDGSGRTPCDVARESGKLECLAMLEASELDGSAVKPGAAGAGKRRI